MPIPALFDERKSLVPPALMQEPGIVVEAGVPMHTQWLQMFDALMLPWLQR